MRGYKANIVERKDKKSYKITTETGIPGLALTFIKDSAALVQLLIKKNNF